MRIEPPSSTESAVSAYAFSYSPTASWKEADFENCETPTSASSFRMCFPRLLRDQNANRVYFQSCKTTSSPEMTTNGTTTGLAMGVCAARVFEHRGSILPSPSGTL